MEDRGDAVHVAKMPLFANFQNTVMRDGQPERITLRSHSPLLHDRG